MSNLLVHMLLLASLLPLIIYLGARYAAWLERLGEPARQRVIDRDGPLPVDRTDDPRPARIASVAVVDGELLVQLVAAGGAGGPVTSWWLNAWPEAAAVDVAERCWEERRLTHVVDTGRADVLLEVGGMVVPMVRLADRAEPPT